MSFRHPKHDTGAKMACTDRGWPAWAVLLEGNPGCGKTSLVMAVARAARRRIVRINLSEQTDMMDLLGSDLPVEGAEGGHFRWCDGVFLQV